MQSGIPEVTATHARADASPLAAPLKMGVGGGAVDVEMEPVTQCHYRSFLVLRGERVNR